jgi:hypothetical protein
MEEIIYVKLLEEGTVCYRPVRAIKLGNNSYKILDAPSEDEIWEFQCNEMVSCSEKEFSDGRCLMAISKV